MTEVTRGAAADGTHSVRRALLGRMLAIAFLLTLVSACGGHSTSARSSSNLPVLTLEGSRVVEQPVGKKYADAGAKAEDPKDGDISAKITIKGLAALDVNTVGDYFIRYDVTNSRGKRAQEAVRIVRVSDERFALESARPLGTNGANMGYYEHLPVDYSKDSSREFPLLIWNHGYGGSREFGSSGDELDVIRGFDIFQLIENGSWDNSLPFIVLMPQRNTQDVVGGDAYTQMKAFIDYAVDVYHADSSRIYMAGFSDGAGFTWEYVRLHLDQLAAAVPISGYAASPGCEMTSTPIWAFQAKDDTTVPWQKTLTSVQAINSCKPSAHARFTLFPYGGHSPMQVLYTSNVRQGDPAYDLYKPDVFTWLLEHHR